MIDIQVRPPLRTIDDYGQGHFGAPRGARKHNGIDFAAAPGSEVFSLTQGQVTKLGYCYRDDDDWRYVEVTGFNGLRHRYFYVEPSVTYGYSVGTATILGKVQDLRLRYPAMESKSAITPHFHYEIKDAAGHYLNPNDYWSPKPNEV